MTSDSVSAPDLRATPLTWVTRILSVAAVVVVVWCCATEWSGISHAHPAYPILLAVTLLGSVFAAWRAWRPRQAIVGGQRVLRIVAQVLALLWIAIIGWLCPLSAEEPALSALVSDSQVTVAESPTQIVLTPTTATPSSQGVFFQPGAKVDARAYVAILRPLAEAGHLVVITKQPLDIAFLATGAFASTRASFPQVTGWIIGGHSLGGTVAAMDADAHDQDATAPAVGLLLYASYPATSMTSTLTVPVLSISGSNDGLATPDKINASKGMLPSGATFTVIQGGVHAFFGDYGPQSGDGTPTITRDEARTQISAQSVAWVANLAR